MPSVLWASINLQYSDGFFQFSDDPLLTGISWETICVHTGTARTLLTTDNREGASITENSDGGLAASHSNANLNEFLDFHMLNFR